MIQSSKLRVTLCTCATPNDVAASKPGEEITEIYGIDATFQINGIPYASISVPLGARIGSGNSLEFAPNTADWSAMMQNRTPVCVKLEVASEEGIAGLETGTYCIFKGYVGGVNTSHSTKSGMIQLSLQHWLVDLAILPILNRISAPENPANISMESCFKPKVNTEVQVSSPIEGAKYWEPAFNARDAILNGTDLFESIRLILSAAAKESMDLKESDAGHVSSELYKIVDKALTHVSGENLELNPVFSPKGSEKVSEILRESMGNAIASVTQDSCYSVTIWNKLVQSLLPTFYMTLIPLANRAVVIPNPGMNMANAREITPANTVKLDVSLSKSGVLAGMSLIANVPMSLSSGLLNTHVSSYRYPEGNDLKAGTIKVCTLPKWLELYSGGNFLRDKAADNFVFARKDSAKTAEQTAEELKTTANDLADGYSKLCRAFLKSTYNSEVTKANSALLIANLDFTRVPGEVLKIEIPRNSAEKSNAKKYIYGVIGSVGFSIQQGSVQSTYRLMNVRDEHLQDTISNSGGALIYNSAWVPKDKTTSIAEKL